MSEIINFLQNSVAGKVSVPEQVKFLERFTTDKISAEDIRVFVDFMRGQMSEKLKMPGAIDICGTGGSGLNRLNTSTISAFILASLGVGVAKHGNKAASGRFGSFDLLEKLGIGIEKSRAELEYLYRREQLAFIYARSFHPAMKFFAEARMAIGKPTIFNVLGPLLNPADTKMQIIGTSFGDLMRVIVEACHLLGKDRVMVVRGEDGLDEVTLSGKTRVVEMHDGIIEEYQIRPADFGVEETTFAEISGGTPEKNTDLALKILQGKCKSRHVDLVYVNAALALKLAGKTRDLKHAYEMAHDAIPFEKFENYKKLSNA